MKKIILLVSSLVFTVQLHAGNNNNDVDKSDTQQIRRQANIMSQQLGVCSSFIDAETTSDWNRCYQLLDSSITARFKNASALETYLKGSISGVNFTKDRETPKAAQISTYGKYGEIAFIKYWHKHMDGGTVVFFILRKDPTTKLFKVWGAYPSRLATLFSSNIIKTTTDTE